MFSSTNSSRPGAASADSRARSYWPSTRVPMNPSRKPSWRVVTQRLARAMVALARPPPGGMTWSSRSASSLPISEREGAGVGADPARPVDDAGALDDARQRAAERRRQGRARSGPSPPRRRARRRAARPDRACPGADRSRSIAMRSTAGQSTSPRAGRALGAPAGDRRRGAERRADQEAGLPDPVVAPRRPPGRARLPASLGHRLATASSTCSTSGKADAEQPARRARGTRSRIAGRRAGRWTAASPAASAGALEPVDRQQLGQRGRGRRRRVDDRDAGPRPAPR